MCYVAISCWRALGSLELVFSSTLLNDFDGISVHLHGILPSFDIQLAGKVVSIEVEVVDSHLDYNLLLGRIWNYSM